MSRSARRRGGARRTISWSLLRRRSFALCGLGYISCGAQTFAAKNCPASAEPNVSKAIAGLHAQARRAEETRWDEIVGLYDVLVTIRSSPVIALNRALALAQLNGPDAGLDAIRAIVGWRG